MLSIQNERLRMEIDVSQGAKLVGLYDLESGRNYFPRESALFSALVRHDLRIGGYQRLYTADSREMQVVSAEADGAQAEILLQHQGVSYRVLLQADRYRNSIAMRVIPMSGRDEAVLVRLRLPAIEYVSVPSESGDVYAMIPSEIGSMGIYSGDTTYGHGPAADTGMPTAFNSLEAAAIFDKESGSGLAFNAVGGKVGGEMTPLQLRIAGHRMEGYWAAQLLPDEQEATPVLAITALDKGWQEAVDLHLLWNQVNRDVTADVPKWLLESGAVYSTRREGTGGSYQCLPDTTDLSTRMSSFTQLPEQLELAKAYGTNVLLLIDFYQPADLHDIRLDDSLMVHAVKPYWNKGDYIPRSDLGGEEAFIEGVKAVQEQGGKVIVYVEPFIVFAYSQLGRTWGDDYAAHLVDGTLDSTYIMNYTMQPATLSWQDHVVEICTRLVDKYGVDGILLDSLGWQWNHLYFTQAERTIYSMDEYNQGLLEINRKVRQAIREIKPDAVVMSESGAGLMLGRNDGGFTADYCWNNGSGNANLEISPTKYAFPTANLFSSGLTINSLNQVFAAGYGLSLCEYWDEHISYIRQLVELRKTYADALIYGQVSYPETDKKMVAAYLYQGSENELLIIVNCGNNLSKQKLLLPGQAGTQWSYLLGGEGDVTIDADCRLEIRVKSETMVVLRKK